MAGRKPQRRREFGTVRKLPSGRWQARYIGPDGQRYTAPETFETRSDAQDWLKLLDFDPESVASVKPIKPDKGEEYARNRVI